jgi:hypothetical protein
MRELLERAERLTLELQDAAKHWAPPADLAEAEKTVHELMQAAADVEWLIVQCRFQAREGAGEPITKEQP